MDRKARRHAGGQVTAKAVTKLKQQETDLEGGGRGGKPRGRGEEEGRGERGRGARRGGTGASSTGSPLETGRSCEERAGRAVDLDQARSARHGSAHLLLHQLDSAEALVLETGTREP